MEIAYEVFYHPLVLKKDIPALAEVWKERIKSAIEQKLVQSPELFGLPLRTSLKGHRKLRVGDYRVVFKIERKSVYILAILHRARVYQFTSKRI